LLPEMNRSSRSVQHLGWLGVLLGSPVLHGCDWGSSEQPAVALPCAGSCDDGNAVRPVALPRPICPAAEPMLGAACDLPDKLCTYGDSRRAACRNLYACADGVWTFPTTFEQAICPSPDCPAEVPEGEECLLPYGGPPTVCQYPDFLTCACGQSRYNPAATVTHWSCYGLPTDTRCPKLLPNVGDGCATRALECTYEPPANLNCVMTNAALVCSDGEWQLLPGVSCVD
jgi:hypothetical protein